MEVERATELSIMARHNKDRSASVSPQAKWKRGEAKSGMGRGDPSVHVITGLSATVSKSQTTPTFNKFCLSPQMSVRHPNRRAALKNQCKQAEGVSAAPRCKSTASRLGPSQDVSFSWLKNDTATSSEHACFKRPKNSEIPTLWEQELLGCLIHQQCTRAQMVRLPIGWRQWEWSH